MLVLQKLQVGNLVTSKTVDNLILRQKISNLSSSLLIFLQLCQNILSLLGILSGRVSNAVKVAVQSRNIISHVGILQQLDLSRQDLLSLLIVALLFGLVAFELDEREQQVSAKMWCQLGHN